MLHKQTILTAPTVFSALEVDMGHHFVEHRQLNGHLATRIQNERSPIKDLVVLATHHVQVHERQPCLHNARNHVIQSRFVFAPVIW